LTRTLKTPLVVADAVVAAVTSNRDAKARAVLSRLHDGGARELRGRTAPVKIWIWDTAS
jgi:hypothetical protein